MYAIVEIAGQQFKVSKDQKIFVHRLDESEGSEVIFDKVLLIDQNGAITLGAPAIDGASVQAKVLRQFFTEISVEEILATGGKKAPAKESKPKKSQKDDLTKVEGIGPKAAEALAKVGVDTFEKLSKKSVEEIRTILVEASKTLAHLDPQTWAQQARLAADGKWDELKKWQDELNGGIVK